jgi:hypothetical protein
MSFPVLCGRNPDAAEPFRREFGRRRDSGDAVRRVAKWGPPVDADSGPRSVFDFVDLVNARVTAHPSH